MKIILRVNSNRCIHYAWGKLYKKDVIEKNEHYPVGMLNEDVEGMFKAVLKSEKIAETNKIGYFYYENSESISRKNLAKIFYPCIMYGKEFWKYLRILRRNMLIMSSIISLDQILLY